MKSPFEDFINKLESVSQLPEEPDNGYIVELAHGYVDKLISKYGLPYDDDAKAFLTEVIELSIATTLTLDAMKGNYLSVFLWDTIADNKNQPLTAMKMALLYGFCVHILLELEEGYEDEDEP